MPPAPTTPVTLRLREADAVPATSAEVCTGVAERSCLAVIELNPGIGQRSFVLDVVPTSGVAVDARVACAFERLER